MSRTNSPTRVLWIDYVKAFAIITVVMLHIPILDPYRHIARSFVIPLFFLLSGLFSHPERYATYPSFLRHKTLRLLLPYILFNLINYLYWLIIARHYGADAGTEMSLIRPLLGILLGIEPWMYHYKPLWFLPCLMVTEILFYSAWRLSSTLHKAYLLPVIILCLSATGYILSCAHVPPLPYAIGGAFTMMLFYYLGYVLASHRQTVHTYTDVQTHPIFLILITVISMTLCIVLSLQTAETRVFENSYGNILYALPAAICGCVALSGIAILLSNALPTLRLLQYIGSHTLVILGIHLTVASFVKGFTTFVCQQPLSIYQSLWVRLLLVVAVVLCSVPLCYLYDKITIHKTQ